MYVEESDDNEVEVGLTVELATVDNSDDVKIKELVCDDSNVEVEVAKVSVKQR